LKIIRNLRLQTFAEQVKKIMSDRILLPLVSSISVCQ
jgi:hypothetical protein